MISSPPLIAVTPWRRDHATFVHPVSDLYTIEPHYLEALSRAGAVGALVPWVSSREEARAVLARFDGLLLSGGQDVDPAFYGAVNTDSVDTNSDADTSDLAMLGAATDLGIPVLGICRGAQVINVGFGGTLRQEVWGTSEYHPARPDTEPGSDEEVAAADAFLANRHPVMVNPGSGLVEHFDADLIQVNSLHHQAVDEAGEGIMITGRAADGMVEIIEHERYEVLGVQWHPERLIDEGHLPVFEWLTSRASKA